MTHLDEKALEAAYSESGAHPWASSGEQCEKFLNAYLSALPSSPVSELVERLNGENPDKVVATDRLRMYAHDPDTFEFDQHDALSLIPIIEEAASTLTSLTTRNAELEREVKRLREAAGNAYRACMSAWACGEPPHRVKTMIEEVEHLGVAISEAGAAALSTSPQGGEHE